MRLHSFLLLFLITIPFISAEEFIEITVLTKNGTVKLYTDNGNNENTFHCDRENKYRFLLRTGNKPTLDKIVETLQLQAEIDKNKNNWDTCELKAKDLLIELAEKKSQIVSCQANKSIAESCDQRISQLNGINEEDIKKIENENTLLIITNVTMFVVMLILIIASVYTNFKKNKEE